MNAILGVFFHCIGGFATGSFYMPYDKVKGCLAIAFYFSSKKSGADVAKKKIEILCRNINITTINEKLSQQAIQNAKIHDFDDGLEYYSALNESCNFIVTENREDFYFSEIPVVNSEQFLFEHLKK